MSIETLLWILAAVGLLNLAGSVFVLLGTWQNLRFSRVILPNLLATEARLNAMVEWLHSASLTDIEAFQKREKDHYTALRNRSCKALGIRVEETAKLG